MAEEPIRATPLHWPAGWKRTANGGRKNGQFHRDNKWLTVSQGVGRVRAALAKMHVREDDLVISTNVPVRLDGLPRSDAKAPGDPGVAVYWQVGKERRCMAIDRYSDVADNLAAIAATLDAMRAIERHGGAAILDRAFTGFTALPSPDAVQPWHEVLGVAAHAPSIEVREAIRRLRSEAHPDRPGGSHDRMAKINAATAEFEKERGFA